MDGDMVTVHYTGTLDDGEEFDSSRERGPLSFVLGSGQMISGFDVAVHGLRVGDAITVRLKPSEAYGERDDDLISRAYAETYQGGTISVVEPGSTTEHRILIGYSRGNPPSVMFKRRPIRPPRPGRSRRPESQVQRSHRAP